MTLSRKLFSLAAVAAAFVLLAGALADARPSMGGSRGSRTFSAPPVTNTAPRQAAPIERTITQPNVARPGTPAAAPNTGGFFNRPGLLGGLAAGFLGAGLLGMLFGNGFLGGMGGFASMLGLLLQIALVVIVARLAWSWWQRRNGNGYAFAGPTPGAQQNQNASQRSFLNGAGFGGSQPTDDVKIVKEDYDAFEDALIKIQTAYGQEDLATLQRLATPEMVMYFSEDLSANSSRGVKNEIADVKLLQGDLAEAWREGAVEYATLAMRFSLTDRYVDRATGRVVEGGETEAVELWTFMRSRGGHWMLSAIQNAG
jgi:predicted lipid-binding transport protein (Tim44 family)